ncbi:MAG: PAS domain S-box protein [bacterium]
MKDRNKIEDKLIHEMREPHQRVAELEALASEHERAQEALRRSEEKYRNILESIQDGYFEVDLAGNFTSLNSSMCRIFGYPQEELIGMNDRQYTDCETAKRLFQAFNQVYRTEEPHKGYDYEIIRKDGSRRVVEASVSIRKDASGKPIGFRGIGRDITERKKMEEALLESESKFRNLVENSIVGVYLIQDGLFKYVNPLGAEIHGYKIAEMIDKMGPKQTTLPEDWSTVEGSIGKRMKGEEDFIRYEFRIATKSQEIRNVEVFSSRTIYHGRPAVLGTMVDVTERKRVEEALRQSEEKYRTIIENIEEGYYEVDLAGSFTFFNDSMCRILGYPKEELMGMNNRRYTDQENAKRLFQAFNQVYRTGEPGRGFDNELIRKDGTKRYVEASISLKKDSSGCPVGFRGIVRDITERKRFEEILQQERETFFSILQKEPYGALLINTDETFLYVNPEFTSITGYTLNDVPNGREWFRKAYPDPEYRHKAIALWKEDVALRRGGDRVWSVVRKDGQVKEIEFKLTFLDDGRVIVMLSDVTERKRTEEELAYKATHDLLTGLPNRMLFKDRFNVAKAQAQRVHKKLAVVFLDLDRFKEVNDTLGHDAGDGLLCAVGDRLIDLVRKSDTVARMGGDEFLLLLPDTDQVEDAIRVAQKVQDVLQAPFIMDGHEICIGASIGIAIYPDDGTDVDSLVSHADKAMYEAKQRRHNSYPPFPQTVTDHPSE